MTKLIGGYLLGVILTVGALANACAQSVEATQLMEATNQDRAQHGLGPLHWDPALARAAQRHAELMVGQRALSRQLAGEAELETRVGQPGCTLSRGRGKSGRGANPRFRGGGVDAVAGRPGKHSRSAAE